jgi:ADP-ribose pyrophosphatase
MRDWNTHNRTIVLQRGKFLTVEDHSVELPNGQMIDDWPWVITPDFANVIAITEDDQFLCFRQTKYAVAGITLAVPGGYIEMGEEPLEAAQRELREETGYAASDWVDLGQYAVDGNRGAGVAHLFLARNARQIEQPDADDLEEQELLLLSRAEVWDALRQGKFKVLPWTAAIALALLYTGE